MFTLLHNSAFRLLDLADNEPMKQRPVRRNLFGTPTPEKQATDFLTQEHRLNEDETTKRFMKQWNFDPLTGIPMKIGLFDWSQVKRKDDAPSFYFKSYAPSKSRPVHTPRRERSFSTPYSRQHIPIRPLIRGHISRTQNDEEKEFSSDVHTLERVIVDAEAQLTTPKPLRSSSPLPSPSSQDSDPTSSNSSSTCSALEIRSRPVSTNSPGFTNMSNGSLKQQTIKDHYQVKRPRYTHKSMPRT